MQHYSARQRQSDSRWDYTCGRTPIGYCCEYAPIPLDAKCGLHPEEIQRYNDKMAPLASKFHGTGHATEDEACDCYKEYLLDTSLRLILEEPANASQQHRCQVCKKFTACYAMVGCYRTFTLCPEHQTRENVSDLLEVGESWES